MIYFLNSKKCSICSLIGLTLLLGANPSGAATAPAPSTLTSIAGSLRQHRKRSFDDLLDQWQSEFGEKAVPALLTVARDKQQPDRSRYIAVLATAKLGGAATLSTVLPFLKDKSWLIRLSALRAIQGLQDHTHRKEVFSLLKDRSLVLRNEAVKVIASLQYDGSAEALIDAALDRRNYHQGRAQWVPLTALKLLPSLAPKKELMTRLRPMLFHSDARVVAHSLSALDSVMGNPEISKKPHQEKLAYWKAKLK